MRLVVLGALLLALFAGCVGNTPTESDPEQKPETQSSVPSVLYLHADEDRLWMDGDQDASSGAVEGRHLPAGEAPWHSFTMDPAPAEDLHLHGPIAVRLVVQNRDIIGASPEHQVRLVVDGHVVAEGTGTTRILLDAPDIPACASVAFEFCVCPRDGSVSYAYAIRVGGESRLELPVGAQDAAGPTQATRTASTVQAGQRTDGSWYARQTIIITEPVEAGSLDLLLDTRNGGVTVRPGGDAYRVVASLEGRGQTEAEARSNLEALEVRHESRTAGEAHVLHTRIVAQEWRNKQASLAAEAPVLPVPSLVARTSNGPIGVEGFSGHDWSLHTSNGAITVEGHAADLEATTSNGQIRATGTVDHLRATSSNGGVELDLKASATGSWTATTSNGQVRLKAPEDAARGYDVQATTSNGHVTFTFADTEPVGEQKATARHERTTGFEARDIQTTVRLSTSNGNVAAGS